MVQKYGIGIFLNKPFRKTIVNVTFIRENIIYRTNNILCRTKVDNVKKLLNIYLQKQHRLHKKGNYKDKSLSGFLFH